MKKENFNDVPQLVAPLRKAHNLLSLCLTMTPVGLLITLLSGYLGYFYFESGIWKNAFYFMSFLGVGFTYSMITGLFEAKKLIKDQLTQTTF